MIRMFIVLEFIDKILRLDLILTGFNISWYITWLKGRSGRVHVL